MIESKGDGTWDVTFNYVADAGKTVKLAAGFTDPMWGDTTTVLTYNESTGVYSYTMNFEKAGNYAYKYIVDGDWKTDPLNDQYTEDGNSKLVIKGATQSPVISEMKSNGKYDVTFNYVADAGKEVKLAGSFTQPTWGDSTTVLTRGDDGVYTVTLEMDPGTNYQYKFVVDGTWEKDSLNGKEEGDNSKIVLPSAVTSPEIDGKSVTFRRIAKSTVEKVRVAGSMTNWGTEAWDMTKDDTGVWSVTKQIDPGLYEYNLNP